MQTLTYGLKVPETGDRGSVWFPALEDNFERLDAHNHDGSDSPKLTAAATTVVTQSVASGSWVATTNGTYRQLVTVPAAIASIDEVRVQFRHTTTGDYYHLKTEKVSATTYYAYINDNSLTVTAVYTS